MAINPYEAPQAEVERAAAFRPRRLARFLGIAVVNLCLAVTTTVVVLPLLLYLVVWNYESGAVSLPMLYVPILLAVNTVGLVSSAVGLLVNPRWGWILTVGYCFPGLIVVAVVFVVKWQPLVLLGAPYPAIVLALLLSSTARRGAGVSRARPQRRWPAGPRRR